MAIFTVEGKFETKVIRIRIRIFGLIWIRISVEYPFQNCDTFVGVIHFAKLG